MEAVDVKPPWRLTPKTHTMENPIDKKIYARGALPLAMALGMTSAVLLAVGRKDYPDLHIILDTGMCLLSGILAWQFWDSSQRIHRPFLACIGISFTITSLMELIHVLVTVEWSGPLAPIAAAANQLRPATWPPAAYVLPIGIGISLWLMQRERVRAAIFAPALFLLAAILIAAFSRLPQYTVPVAFGITRPALLFVPLLWALVGWQCWRLRAVDRALEPLAFAAAILFLAHFAMLYSRAPHDTAAMVAHLGKVGGYLVLLMTMVQMASMDMSERIKAERQLAQLNAELEGRVIDRTAQLEATNRHLLQEVRERQRAEEATRFGQQLLQAIIDNSMAVIYVKDVVGRYLLVNRRYEDIFNLKREAILGRTDHDLFSKEVADAFRAMDKRVATAGQALTETETVPQADGVRTYLSVKFPLFNAAGRPYAVSGISTDITDRERDRKAQFQLAAIVQSSDDAIISKTLDGIILSWNPGAQKLFGYTAQEAVGRPLTMLIPPDRLGEESEILARLSRGEAIDHFETVRLAKDGRLLDVSVTVSPLKNDQGELIGASKIARDITERRHAERKIQAHLAKLDLLSRTTRAIGERQDLHSILQVAIRSLEEDLPIDFGCVCLYEPSQQALTVACVGVKSLPLALQLAMPEKARIEIDQNGLSQCVRGQLVHEPDIRHSKFPFPQRLASAGLGSLVAAPLMIESKVFGVVLAARREIGQFTSGDCEFLRQLSEHLALAMHQAEMYGALQRAYEDLRQTQQSVMQHERLRVLGQLASGIAHDINNALSPAALYAQSLLDHDTTLSSDARSYLVVIQRAIEGVAHTVARMREFYRRDESQLSHSTLDLNRILEQVIDLTRARWGAMAQERGMVIHVRPDLAAGLPEIMGVESEIRDAFTNLILNAVDAMPSGGTLTLRTQALESNQVRVEVIDTGIGMDDATRSHCLEPFFTTKGERGTGLGLAMVYGMIERHGGEIDIKSEVGQGTAIGLTFPPLVASAATRDDRAPLPVPQPRRLRILFVDDDPIVLKSLRETLEQDGHVVAVADGGERGIEAFRVALERGEGFAAVITDLGMPHVDGRKVALAVKAIAPDVPVILLTGWGHRLLAENDKPPSVDRVLSKPPKLAALRIALAELTQAVDK